MNRLDLEKYILETYNAKTDHPWEKYSNYAVFRHIDNRKWFALIMDVPKNKLGLQEDGILDVVNLKCDPFIVGSLLKEKGIFPAYHMNKENWITVALDDNVPDDELKALVEMSFEATSSNRKA